MMDLSFKSFVIIIFFFSRNILYGVFLYHWFLNLVQGRYAKIFVFLFFCVTEQHYVSIFSTRLWSAGNSMLFSYIGWLVTSQQKCHFILSSLNIYWPFGFVFVRMRSWNPEISGFCVSKIRELPADHKRVKKIETQCCSVTQTIFLCDILLFYLYYEMYFYKNSCKHCF